MKHNLKKRHPVGKQTITTKHTSTNPNDQHLEGWGRCGLRAFLTRPPWADDGQRGRSAGGRAQLRRATERAPPGLRTEWRRGALWRHERPPRAPAPAATRAFQTFARGRCVMAGWGSFVALRSSLFGVFVRGKFGAISRVLTRGMVVDSC